MASASHGQIMQAINVHRESRKHFCSSTASTTIFSYTRVTAHPDSRLQCCGCKHVQRCLLYYCYDMLELAESEVECLCKEIGVCPIEAHRWLNSEDITVEAALAHQDAEISKSLEHL